MLAPATTSRLQLYSSYLLNKVHHRQVFTISYLLFFLINNLWLETCSIPDWWAWEWVSFLFRLWEWFADALQIRTVISTEPYKFNSAFLEIVWYLKDIFLRFKTLQTYRLNFFFIVIQNQRVESLNLSFWVKPIWITRNVGLFIYCYYKMIWTAIKLKYNCTLCFWIYLHVWAVC